MSSFNFEKIADKMIAEHTGMLDALLEFERTKKLPKLSYKTRVNFTIDHKVIKKLREYCRKKGCKMSTLVESMIKEKIYKN